jgi:hypothetical protein
MALLYGRAGRLTALFGGFRPGQHSQPLDESDGIMSTRLYPLRLPADTKNDEYLQRLPGGARTYVATDTGPEKELKDCRAKKELTLKVGAQVVCLRNIKRLQLVNGSKGVVTALHEGQVTVRFTHGQTHALGPMSMPGYRRKQVPLDLAWALTIHSSRECHSVCHCFCVVI